MSKNEQKLTIRITYVPANNVKRKAEVEKTSGKIPPEKF